MQKKNLLLNSKEMTNLVDFILELGSEYIADIDINLYATFKKEIIDHGCRFGLK